MYIRSDLTILPQQPNIHMEGNKNIKVICSLLGYTYILLCMQASKTTKQFLSSKAQ